MSGVGNNNFNPQGFYTREQAILTVYRLYNSWENTSQIRLIWEVFFTINYEIIKSIFPQLAPGKRNFKVIELEFPNKVDHVPELSNLLVVYQVDCTLGLSITILADVLILSLLKG